MQTLPRPTGPRVMKVLPVHRPPLMFPDVVWTQEEKFLYMADFIESLPPEHFDMNFWFYIPWGASIGAHGSQPVSLQEMPVAELLHTCGTTGCLAGWLAADQIHPAFTFKYDYEVQDFATKWFGIDEDQGQRLFCNPTWWGRHCDYQVYSLSDVLQEDVVEVLRGIASGDIEL